MTLTTAQQVRTKIQDYPSRVIATYYGNGTATTFLLPDRNLTTATAYVPTPGLSAWTATGATFDPTAGTVMFSGQIADGSAFQVDYFRSTFSDDEIGTFITAGGGVIGAACEACEALMFDSFRRSRWAASNGQSFDDTKVLEQISTIYGTLTARRAQDALANGGYAEWGYNQGDY